MNIQDQEKLVEEARKAEVKAREEWAEIKRELEPKREAFRQATKHLKREERRLQILRDQASRESKEKETDVSD